MMNTSPLILISFITIILTGCASSGSGPKSDDFCPQSYSSTTALWLGKLANLAYEEKRKNIKTALNAQGLTLDSYDFRNKEYSVGGFIAYDANRAVLVFTGSEDIKDWQNNAKTWSEAIEDKTCGKKVKLHSGFYEASREIIEHDNGALFSHLLKLQKQGKKIYITGHSLGGAMATVAAYFSKSANQPINISGVYTFGQPFTGDGDFQNCFNKELKDRTFRFVADKDIIPKTRLDKSYRHIGLFLFFDGKGTLGTSKPSDYAGNFLSFVESNLLDAHSMTNYLSLLETNKGINPFSCH